MKFKINLKIILGTFVFGGMLYLSLNQHMRERNFKESFSVKKNTQVVSALVLKKVHVNKYPPSLHVCYKLSDSIYNSKIYVSEKVYGIVIEGEIIKIRYLKNDPIKCMYE